MCQYRKGDLHMTKTQLRSRLRKLLDKLGDIRAELYDLRDEVEETKDNIEPYEGYDDLTPEQEERQEYFEEAYNALDEVLDSLSKTLMNWRNIANVDYQS